MGAPFAYLFCYFVKSVITNELEIVLGRLICQFFLWMKTRKTNVGSYTARFAG